MMQPTRFIVSLGVLAGSLTISTVAQADIPVTGGRATGDAAFFLPSAITPGATNTPTPAGAPILFDTSIKTLTIVTPSGTTTTSRFTPNASRFSDVNGNNTPDKGDTGRLEGTLSGVAFSSGNPVFFQNVPTALDFKLDTFSPNQIQGGTLVSPKEVGTAPLVFLPLNNVTLSSEASNTFKADAGLLNVGPFAADLTGDFIGLPANLQFQSGGSASNEVVVLGRRIKFDFEGKNVLPTAGTDLNPLDGTLAFNGPTTKFKVQSVGTPGTREFKIEGEGTTTNLDIKLSAPSFKQEGTLSNTASTSYEIKGESAGSVAFGTNNGLAFTETSRRDTNFKFEQATGKLDGKSGGNINFVLTSGATGSSSFSPVVGNNSVNNNGTTFTQTPPLTSTTTGTSSSTGTSTSTSTSSTSSTSLFVLSSVRVNAITTDYKVFNVWSQGDDDDDDRDDGRNLAGRSDDDDNDDGDDDDDRAYGRNYVYYIYQQRGPVEVVVEQDDDDRILVVERTQVRGRKLKQRGRVLSAYQVVGMPSRVFPGLVGLRQIAPEAVQSTPGASTGDDDADDTTGGTTTPSDSTTPSGTSTTPSGTTTPSSTPDATTAPAEPTTTP